MKTNNNLFAALIGFILFISMPIYTVHAYIIPSSDREDWSVAGLYIDTPSIADTVFQVNLMSGATWDDKVEEAISQAKSYINNHPTNWAIVYFPGETITLSSSIILDHTYRNIIFQGAGSNRTTLKFSFGGTNQNCFEIKGEQQESSKRYLASDLQKGSTSIECETPIGYSTPCWIRLCEEDHPYNDDDSWAYKCVGQITRLESTGSTTGTLKDKASKQYTESRNTAIWPINPAMNIGIENMTIKREDTGHPGAGEKGINIVFKFAVNC